jgi:tetratricopeptide (TPR) repeat protein
MAFRKKKLLQFTSTYLFVLIIFLPVLKSCNRPEVKDPNEENKRHQLAVLLDYTTDEISRFPKKLLKDLNKADFIAEDLQDSNSICLILLEKSKCYRRLELIDSSFVLVMNASQLAKTIKNDTLLAKANNEAGNIYMDMNNFVTASKYYSNAMDIAETIQNPVGKAALLNNLGLLYYQIGENERAIKYFNEAVLIFDSLNDNYRKAHAYLNLIPAYVEMKDRANVIQCYNRAYSIFKAYNDSLKISKLMLNISTFYEQIGQYDSVMRILNSVIRNAKKMNNKCLYCKTLNNLGFFYYSKLNEPKKGKLFIDSSLQISRETLDLNMQMISLSCLSEIEITQGNFKKGFENYQQYIKIRDSILGDDVKKAIISNDLQNIIDKREFKAALLQQKLELRDKQNLILWIYIFSILLFVIMLGLFIRASYKSLKKTNTINELENERLERQLELDRKMNEIEKFKLDAELEAKKKEMISYSLKLITKNDLLDNISKLANTYYNNNCLDSLFYNDLTRIIKDNLNIDREWNQFKSLFEKVHHNFFNKLKQYFPNLTQHDLRFCAYIRINLRPKEIASLLNIGTNSVKTYRNRLRKKLGLDIETGLDDFLRNF